MAHAFFGRNFVLQGICNFEQWHTTIIVLPRTRGAEPRACPKARSHRHITTYEDVYGTCIFW